MTTPNYHQAALDRVATFPAKDGERLFLNCWIPEEALVSAFASCMAAHGDPTRWWDGLQEHLS